MSIAPKISLISLSRYAISVLAWCGYQFGFKIVIVILHKSLSAIFHSQIRHKGQILGKRYGLTVQKFRFRSLFGPFLLPPWGDSAVEGLLESKSYCVSVANSALRFLLVVCGVEFCPGVLFVVDWLKDIMWPIFTEEVTCWTESP